MSDTKQYPEWQKGMREAQAAEQTKRDAEIAKREEAAFIEKMKEEERLQAGFKKACALLHLPIPEDGTRMVLDGFTFTLRWYSAWQRVGRTLSTGEVPDTHKFMLALSKVMPDDIDPKEYEEFTHQPYGGYNYELAWPQDEAIFELGIDEQLTPATLAKIAAKLDYLDMVCPELADKFRAWKKQVIEAKARYDAEEASQSTDQPSREIIVKEKSIDERLVALIRDIIREEIRASQPDYD